MKVGIRIFSFTDVIQEKLTKKKDKKMLSLDGNGRSRAKKIRKHT